MQPRENVEHMAVPGGPRATIRTTHFELAFSFPLLEALFNGPTHDGGFAQLRERYIDGRIGEGEFSFPIRRSSDEEPYLKSSKGNLFLAG